MKSEDATVGLCLTCRHARAVTTSRSRFWLCQLSARDPRFEKYPRLPVRSCPGYERSSRGGESEGSEGGEGGSGEAGHRGSP